MTRLWAALIFVLLAGPAAAFTLPWQSASPREDRLRPVVSIIVTDQPHPGRSVPGVIAARIDVILGFQTLGRLVERRVDIGDLVRKGDLLAALDPDDLQGNVAAAEAAVEAARVGLETAQAAAARTRELVQRGVAPEAQLEQAENALISAQAAFQQATSECVRARDAEGFANMNAPFSGVVSDVYQNSGAVVSAGAPILKLSNDAQLDAVIDLPEIALADIGLGDSFDVWTEDKISPPRRARVRVIEPLADAATRTRRVRLSLRDTGELRIGTLIRARPRSRADSSLSVPEAALIRRSDGVHLWVVLRDDDPATGRVSLRKVTVAGAPRQGQSAVTSGLSAGDEVVIRGIHALKEGDLVGKSIAP